MKYAVIALVALLLTACATPPKFVSSYFDRQDPCQKVGKTADYKLPKWCGSSQGQVLIVQKGLGRGTYVVDVR